MSNLMTKLYIAYVVDIIYENGKPNFNLRVRVPSIHGASNATGINDADLPIAKPLFSPGVGYNQSLLEETLQNVNKVYVIFESGNYSKPVYLGLKNDETLNAIPSNVSQIFFYEQREQFPTLGNPTYIYWAQNLDILYYWEWTDEAETFGDYKPFAGSGLASGNLLLFATNVEANIFGYFKLVVSQSNLDYNETAVNITTGPINSEDQLIAQLVSAPGILNGQTNDTEVQTIGNIRKTVGNSNEYARFRFKVYKRQQNGTETLLGTSNWTPNIFEGVTAPTNYQEFSDDGIISGTIWSDTDMIVIKYYGDIQSSNGNPATYEFQFGGETPVRTIFPVPLGVIPEQQFTIDDLSSGVTPAQYVLASDGQGGVVWQLRGNRNFVYPENETPESQGNQIIIGDLWFEYK